jgi:adenine deaminase
MASFSITGNFVDIPQQKIYYAEVKVNNGSIEKINVLDTVEKIGQPYILPGFIDSHVHIESSMLVPSEFAKLAVVHGTVATISDPHEIANVCGVEGVHFMIDNGKTVPFKFHFGAPSCVPATIFETAGAALNVEEVTTLLQNDDIFYLSEMMNFPGVLNNDETVMQKIEAAKKIGKPVDGHAPGLQDELAKQYIDAGITTDHECFTIEEALGKLSFGMKILIREGSAAKNFEALIDLLNEYPDKIMFCSDDKHPDSLAAGHINELCARAMAKGIDIFKVLQAACINPVLHYKMKVGLLHENDAADFIVIKDLVNFNVIQTYIDGNLVAENGKSFIETNPSAIINNFNCSQKLANDFEVLYHEEENIAVIEALDGQLITNRLSVKPLVENGMIVSDVKEDILKIVVVNRYNDAPVAKGFIKNFGIQQGAIASSVAHDSHNIVAVGVDDESICKAVNLVINEKGGISAVSSSKTFTKIVLPLPIAGLMSNDDGYKIAAAYTAIDKMVKEELGSTLGAPFMTLSFMALLVIPHLKLSDMGLFDGDEFTFINA